MFLPRGQELPILLVMSDSELPLLVEPLDLTTHQGSLLYQLPKVNR